MFSIQCLKSLCTQYSTPALNKASFTSQITKKVVFVSQSEEIFSNLAFEEWLYRNWDFRKRSLLLLWRNSPCVVIGKHQNPFREVNLPYLENACLPFARRQSGGGTVYHDLGNLNCTFFTSRKRYDRSWNLAVIQQALKNNFGIDVEVNSRHDIVVDGHLKVSGSAAKLGREVAYHHCSLLFKADHKQLSLSLKGDLDMKSNATESVRSRVGNISNYIDGNFPVVNVINKIAFQYLDTPSSDDSINPEAEIRQNSDGICLVNPREDWFPGVDEYRSELMSWDWLYGKTPRFTKTVSLQLPTQFVTRKMINITLNVEVFQGLIDRIEIQFDGFVDALMKEAIKNKLNQGLKGIKYNAELLSDIDTILRVQLEERET